MTITLLSVPDHLGRGAVGVGRGPIRYLDAGAERALRERRHEVAVETIERTATAGSESAAIVEVDRAVAAAVSRARTAGRRPLVLAGNCHTALGTLAGLGDPEIGVVWLDSHGDFNTPETTPSGFFDGMPLAVATGRGYEELRARIGLDPPIPDEHVLLMGVRALDPGERANLESSGVEVVRADAAAQAEAAIERLASRVQAIYLHLDIDVVDPSEAPGVGFPAPGGLRPQRVEEIVRVAARRFPIRAAALTAFDPDRDEGDRTLRLGLRLLETLASAAQGSRA